MDGAVPVDGPPWPTRSGELQVSRTGVCLILGADWERLGVGDLASG